VTADAHGRQRVVHATRVVVDARAGDAEQARHVRGRQQRLGERRRPACIRHGAERKRAARRNRSHVAIARVRSLPEARAKTAATIRPETTRANRTPMSPRSGDPSRDAERASARRPRFRQARDRGDSPLTPSFNRFASCALRETPCSAGRSSRFPTPCCVGGRRPLRGGADVALAGSGAVWSSANRARMTGRAGARRPLGRAARDGPCRGAGGAGRQGRVCGGADGVRGAWLRCARVRVVRPPAVRMSGVREPSTLWRRAGGCRWPVPSGRDGAQDGAGRLEPDQAELDEAARSAASPASAQLGAPARP
jgi:hypothetical protein